MKFCMKKPDHRHTVSGRAVNVNKRCTLFLENRWHLNMTSNLEHCFHAKLDNTAKILGEKDLQPTDIRLVRPFAPSS